MTEACYPAEVDVRVLKEFCRSFPSGHDVIDWGHDYGGIFEASSEISPAGVHRLGVLKKIQRKRENNYSADEIYHADPLCIPFLDSLLRETAEKHEEADISARFFYPMENSNSQVDTQKDCFEAFPPELRGMILLHLTTKDVRNLFLASRAFVSSPISQDFWASRFQQNFEFSSIFESKVSGATSRYRDWRSLFHGLRKCIYTLNFQNRKRIWGILQPLVAAIISFSSTTLCGNPHPTFYHRDIGDDKLQWRCASGFILEPKCTFSWGCRVLYTRSANISPEVVAVHFSMIELGGTEFITGLRFVDGHGASADLGYILPGKELYLDIQDKDVEKPNNSSLHGFHLAVRENGIRALATVTASGKVSAWAGSPQNSLRRRLLSFSGKIGKLKGGFDVSSQFLLPLDIGKWAYAR